MDDEQFYEFCAANRRIRIERSATGEIIIMPPAGAETSFRNSDLIAQLTGWAKKDGRGRVFDSNSEFFLPNGAARGPDAAWILASRLDQFSKAEKKKFLYLCPDFVIELTSPSDRLKSVKAKMDEWIANGVKLGWLIDADHFTVTVYRPGEVPREFTDLDNIQGQDPVADFRLDLTDIWRGL
jgi:Uma2 family endonuclease